VLRNCLPRLDVCRCGIANGTLFMFGPSVGSSNMVGRPDGSNFARSAGFTTNDYNPEASDMLENFLSVTANE